MIDCYCSVNCFAVVHTKGCLLDLFTVYDAILMAGGQTRLKLQ